VQLDLREGGGLEEVALERAHVARDASRTDGGCQGWLPLLGAARGGDPHRLAACAGVEQDAAAGLRLVQAFYGREVIDLVGSLVGPDADDAGKAQRESGPMARGALDAVEGDLDHDSRSHRPIAPVVL